MIYHSAPMTDLSALLHAIDALPAGEPAVLATVVRVQGSSYRLPGARMLVDAAGRRTGSVSGGCLESDVARRGRLLSEAEPSQLVNYDGNDVDAAWGFGLGCNGSIDVFIERLSDVQSFVGLARRCMTGPVRGAIATVFGVDGNVPVRTGDRLWTLGGESVECTRPFGAFEAVLAADAKASAVDGSSLTTTYESSNGRVHALVEAVLPPTPLVIFGGGYDAVPLARLAKSMGWHVTVCDRRASHARADHFPDADVVVAGDAETVGPRVRLSADTVAVVMSHSYPDDTAWLDLLLKSPAKYIGVLGPRSRTQRLLDERGDAHWPERLHAPVGLDIGAEGPEQVALAVVAEIVSSISGRSGGPLRKRAGPIHRPSPVRRVVV